MYPSPCSHPVASSSSWSGVHIQVTAGSPLTSSHTGHSSTTAESARMRPARSPGFGEGGGGGLGFAEVFGVEMRPLLDSNAMQRHAARQSGDEPLPHIHRQRLSRREPRPGGECRDVPVNMPPVKLLYDVPFE